MNPQRWASLVGALYGGVILVGFALELGATPFIIGLLAAIPFFAVRAAPAIALVERLRQRRQIAVIAVTILRAMIFALAAIPFIGDPAKQLAALILAQLIITMCGSVGGLAVELTVLQFQHWEFLFAISFALGFHVMHGLSRIKEGCEHSERQVIQQFAAEAVRRLDQLSSIEGLRAVILFPFVRLAERRRQPRA